MLPMKHLGSLPVNMCSIAIGIAKKRLQEYTNLPALYRSKLDKGGFRI